MRRIALVSACTVTAGAVVAAGLAAVLPATGAWAAAASSAPSSVSLPVTSYYQMAVDSADGRVFFSQGVNGSDSIVATNFSGKVLGTIAEPTAVEGIALSPDGSTLYAVLVGSDAVSPAISVIDAASLTQTTTYPLPAGDTPQDVAVQSGKLWVSYGTGPYSKAGIGDFDLSAASPTLQTQPAMDDWNVTPMLAADPAGTGNVLVAVMPNVLFPPAVSYDTSADPVTVRAQGTGLSNCIGNEYDYAIDIAVTPGGAGFIPACDAPQEGDEYLYSTSGLLVQRSYGTIGTPNAVAVASSTGLVAAGGASAPQIADVYTAGGVETNQYKAVVPSSLADRGLGLNADGTELFAVTTTFSGGSDFWLNMYPDPSITPTSVTLSQPANVRLGQPVAINGTLLVGDTFPDNTSIKVTRTGGGQPAHTFTADIRFAGGFTVNDSPPVPGTYTYTANHPATATSAASSATVKVTVVKVTPSLALTVTPATAAYGQAVKFSARLGGTFGAPPTGTVTVYAQRSGSTTKTKVMGTAVYGNESVGGTTHVTQGTTLYAVYSGNADNAAVTATKTVNVYAKVTASIGGYYTTKSGYRLYHHTARLDLSAAVAPVKRGECVQFQVQEYVKKAWRAVVTTGCATLDGKSQTDGFVPVSTYALGVPYRVRADFIRGKDTTNLDADSGFLPFMVEK